MFGQVPTSQTVRQRVYGPAPAGRPPGAGKYVVLQDPGVPDGFSVNLQPDVMKQVQAKYMRSLANKELPPVYQPSRHRAVQGLTNRRISKGMAPKR